MRRRSVEESYVLDHAIFETVTGSQAYGTNTPQSDTDRTGVMVPGPEYTMGLQRFGEYSDFEGDDRKFYGIQKFMALCVENNPSILELLWAPERCVRQTTRYWEAILPARDGLLSKKCGYTYSGYAIEQLHRIERHRKYLLDPPKSPPSRTEMGLPETPVFPTSQLKAVCSVAIEAIPEHMRTDFFSELDQIYGDWVMPLFARYLIPSQRSMAMDWLQKGLRSQARSLATLGRRFLRDEYVEMAAKEIEYMDRLQEWRRYLSWKKSRNKKRAALEEKFGYDCKHAMHLVRLMRMGAEILQDGKVNVDRTDIDAEELREIRNGAWEFGRVQAYAREQDERLRRLRQESSLPQGPSGKTAQKACVEVTKLFYRDCGYV